MRVKCLKLTAFAATALAMNVSAENLPVLGECFKKPEEFQRLNFPGDDLQNPDIKTFDHGSRWIWIVDMTPSTNYDWSLLEKTLGGLCYRAQVVGSDVRIRHSKAAWLIDARIPPVGTTAGGRIIYRMRNGQSFFTMSTCLRYQPSGAEKAVFCEDME